MLDGASKVLNGSFKSLTFQIYNYLSLPPTAIYLTFGLIETELMLLTLGLKLYLIEKLVFQTFNLPSQPTETKYGGIELFDEAFGIGEYLI